MLAKLLGAPKDEEDMAISLPLFLSLPLFHSITLSFSSHHSLRKAFAKMELYLKPHLDEVVLEILYAIPESPNTDIISDYVRLHSGGKKMGFMYIRAFPCAHICNVYEQIMEIYTFIHPSE